MLSMIAAKVSSRIKENSNIIQIPSISTTSTLAVEVGDKVVVAEDSSFTLDMVDNIEDTALFSLFLPSPCSDP